MKTNNGNLPAMPIELSGFGQYAPEAYAGLSKREMFAMPALQAFHSNANIDLLAVNLYRDVAVMAVCAADALLAELEKSK